MKILDLFCGTKSWSKIWEENGHEIETLDIDPRFNPTYCTDILNWNPTKYYDGILASPPCTYFSWARQVWNGSPFETTEEQLALSIRIAQKTFDIIKFINPEYWLVENPSWVGGMQKYFKGARRVDYCMYGFPCMKPTDLWTNIPMNFKRCNHTKKHAQWHEAIPRDPITRAEIPRELVKEVYDAVIYKKQKTLF